MVTAYSLCVKLIGIASVTVILLSGCSHTSELQRGDGSAEESSADYSIIYYIHADSDYLFHDDNGRPVRGNSKVLDSAFKVAEGAVSGEVYIFHHRPENRIMGLFPRRSSRLYHFRNGELINRIKYRLASSEEDFLATETQIHSQIRRHPTEKAPGSYFLFFGHEIPDNEGKNYHQTNPDVAVNSRSFTAGIQKFLAGDDNRYDLIVVSTCNNGTPVMAEHLFPVSSVLLASPQNLHLSHIHSESLNLLESDPGISSAQLAHAMADQSYRRIESTTKTAVTLTVYDFRILQEQRTELQQFIAAYYKSGDLHHYSENSDCRELSFFDEDKLGNGVKTWYKPARFGRNADNSTHSGWGCKPFATGR